jgi:hypothetical protein
MFPDESSEEHPGNFYSDDTQSGKGCLIIMTVILIPVGYLPAPALPAVSIRP